MKKIFKIAILGVILVTLGIFIILKNIAGTTKILVLNTNINKGQIVTEKMVEQKALKNSDVPENIIMSKKEIVGKTLNVDRLKGDYIPKDIVKQTVLSLKEGEVLLTLNVPKSDTSLIREGSELELALINSSSKDPLLVRGIYVSSIQSKQKKESDVEAPKDLIVAKTSEQTASQIAPYVKEEKFKIFVLPDNKKETETIKTEIDKKENISK